MQLQVFVESEVCSSRAHCKACRSKPEWRRSLAKAFTLPDNDPDFACPFGVGGGLGDAVAKVLTRTGIAPIAKKAIQKVTGKPCGCGGRQKAANNAGKAIAGAVSVALRPLLGS